MIKSIMESLHSLLAEGPVSNSGSNSSRGSHHSSRECFMADTSEGHVESVSKEEATPAGNLSGETKGDVAAPPHIGVEQLRAQKWEIDEAGLMIVWEYVEVDQEIKRRGDAFDVSLGGTHHETFLGGVMAPPARVRARV